MRKIPSGKHQVSCLSAGPELMQIFASAEDAGERRELGWVRRWAGRLVRRPRLGPLSPCGTSELIQAGLLCGSPSPVRSSAVQRRLAAILFADVAGYTRLMDEYECETHERLMTLFDTVVDPAIAAASGFIVKNTGDGFLARFDSIGRALECAVAVQRSTVDYEARQPPERRLAFRMGLHVADIVIEARDVYGCGVNLAARLQQLAAPGSIMISASVREQFGSGLPLPTIDLGYVKLKNIPGPVRVFRVVPGFEAEGHQRAATGKTWHLAPASAHPPFVTYGEIQATVSLAAL